MNARCQLSYTREVKGNLNGDGVVNVVDHVTLSNIIRNNE